MFCQNRGSLYLIYFILCCPVANNLTHFDAAEAFHPDGFTKLPTRGIPPVNLLVLEKGVSIGCHFGADMTFDPARCFFIMNGVPITTI